MRMIELSDIFYRKYGEKPEILKKDNRPYACLTFKIDDMIFAIPIRHNITHEYSFRTIENRGLDYTKAVVIEEESYISGEAWIETTEWNIIKRNENAIFVGFCRYLNQY